MEVGLITLSILMLLHAAMVSSRTISPHTSSENSNSEEDDSTEAQSPASSTEQDITDLLLPFLRRSQDSEHGMLDSSEELRLLKKVTDDDKVEIVPINSHHKSKEGKSPLALILAAPNSDHNIILRNHHKKSKAKHHKIHKKQNRRKNKHDLETTAEKAVDDSSKIDVSYEKDVQPNHIDTVVDHVDNNPAMEKSDEVKKDTRLNNDLSQTSESNSQDAQVRPADIANSGSEDNEDVASFTNDNENLQNIDSKSANEDTSDRNHTTNVETTVEQENVYVRSDETQSSIVEELEKAENSDSEEIGSGLGEPHHDYELIEDSNNNAFKINLHQSGELNEEKDSTGDDIRGISLITFRKADSHEKDDKTTKEKDRNGEHEEGEVELSSEYLSAVNSEKNIVGIIDAFDLEKDRIYEQKDGGIESHRETHKSYNLSFLFNR